MIRYFVALLPVSPRLSLYAGIGLSPEAAKTDADNRHKKNAALFPELPPLLSLLAP